MTYLCGISDISCPWSMSHISIWYKYHSIGIKCKAGHGVCIVICNINTVYTSWCRWPKSDKQCTRTVKLTITCWHHVTLIIRHAQVRVSVIAAIYTHKCNAYLYCWINIPCHVDLNEIKCHRKSNGHLKTSQINKSINQ